ncbi:YeeE/YedE family protein [Georhizobium profundi]|uniref:YeeE/YedE family protein n=1 Tax=Georhizobium profundi TaxID=2341112 RepID=A0A3Q8XSD2_9HYPH|nr:YeeE/YedE thiosulfate transporter family protein [Georhizobium profundi]AZN72582.1 YeeE/YedE family protein [Georhizobium profundi]
MTEFTPIASLMGGMMIGLSATLLMLWEGRVAGISGIAGRLLPPYRDGAFLSRFGFVVGLIAAPVAIAVATGEAVQQTVSSNVPLMIAAGLLVGFGSVWGNGCTSGHGVCGLSRLSARSIVATCVFMATAFATVFLVRHMIGS